MNIRTSIITYPTRLEVSKDRNLIDLIGRSNLDVPPKREAHPDARAWWDERYGGRRPTEVKVFASWSSTMNANGGVVWMHVRSSSWASGLPPQLASFVRFSIFYEGPPQALNVRLLAERGRRWQVSAKLTFFYLQNKLCGSASNDPMCTPNKTIHPTSLTHGCCPGHETKAVTHVSSQRAY